LLNQWGKAIFDTNNVQRTFTIIAYTNFYNILATSRKAELYSSTHVQTAICATPTSLSSFNALLVGFNMDGVNFAWAIAHTTPFYYFTIGY